MREQEDICCTCKLDKPWGCNTSIKVMDVVKGVGVVGCGRYELDEKKAKFYGPWHLPQAIVPTESPSVAAAETGIGGSYE